MQDAEKFQGIMFSGARTQLLGAVTAIGLGLTLPLLGIAFAMDLHHEPAQFSVAFLITAVTTGGLALSCFYDAYGPVIEAQRQAAQQKAFNIAVSVGQASVDVALAASAPKEALKTIQRNKDGEVRFSLGFSCDPLPLTFTSFVHLAHAASIGFCIEQRSPRFKMSNPLEPTPAAGRENMFETD